MARRRDRRKQDDRSWDGTHPSSDSPTGNEEEPTHSRVASKPSSLTAGLYLVATPIGNAADITLRALDVLVRVDVVACEDTRVTGNLLRMHGIAAELTSYHEHNAERARPRLIERMKQGESVALASDAGTPLVSDPGYRLVRACVEQGIAVTALPGPSAVLTALQLSGLPSDRFLFRGFLPPRKGPRRRALAELAGVPATLVVLESPRRVAALLADMAEILGSRPAAVARELTKMFEEVRRDTLPALAAHYAANGPPRGEVTVVVAPPDSDAEEGPEATADDIDRALLAALSETGVREAAARVALALGLSRRRLYARALELKRV